MQKLQLSTAPLAIACLARKTGQIASFSPIMQWLTLKLHFLWANRNSLINTNSKKNLLNDEQQFNYMYIINAFTCVVEYFKDLQASFEPYHKIPSKIFTNNWPLFYDQFTSVNLIIFPQRFGRYNIIILIFSVQAYQIVIGLLLVRIIVYLIEIFLYNSSISMGAVASQLKIEQYLPPPSLSVDASRSQPNQNIQNEDPHTNLSYRIGQQFKNSITASKNLMNTQSIPQLRERQESASLPIAEEPASNPQAEKPQDGAIGPVFEVLSRMNFKRPTFQMIQIDPKKFLKTKGNSIYDDYELIKEIGKGGFGSVFRARQIRTGSLRAVKKISKRDLTAEEKLHLANQFEILCKLDHPNIIKLYDIYDDKSNLFVVTELCEGGDLLRFVNGTRMTEKIMRSVMVQVLSAIKYMHSFKILHRDIKLENIVLVKKVASEHQRIDVKLIDFGISINLQKPLSPHDTEPQGTLLYMSPESLSNRLGLEADLWSCGIALYMMTTRKLPYNYESDNELVRNVQKGKINRNNLQKLSLDLKVFMMQLLDANPDARCTASKAINSSWLKKYSQNSSLTVSTRVRAAKNLLDYDAKNNLVSIIEAYLIYKKVGQDERQRLASIFQEIDEDKSGIIEIDELKKFYSENSEHYDAEQVEELLEVMDKNKSGKIDFNEFITAMCDRRLLFQKQALEEAFDFIDKDKSGEISRQELEQILEGVKHQEMQYLFSELDKNHDFKISKKEFMAYLSKYE